MIDDKKYKYAKSVFDMLCETLNEHSFYYEKDINNFTVSFSAKGESEKFDAVVNIDADRALICLKSLLPVSFAKNRVEGAIAVCHASSRLVHGSFSYDYNSDKVSWRLTSSYLSSVISKDLLYYVVGVSCSTIDGYLGQFLKLADGQMTIGDFLKLD